MNRELERGIKLDRMKISGSLKLHVGGWWGKQKTLVQFPHSTFKINSFSGSVGTWPFFHNV